MKFTKIICTVGPKSYDESILSDMACAGMDIVRINMAHGSYDFHSKTIEVTREVSDKLGRYIGIILDLQGPKIRTGKTKKETITLNKGDKITLTTEDLIGDWQILSVNYKKLPEEVKTGDRILLDDGNIELKVTEVKGINILCKIVNGGTISSFRGVNLPRVRISLPSLTEKDEEDLNFGLKMGIDYLALSFVRSPEDILYLKEKLKNRGKNIPVIAKIEKPEAIKKIDKIIKLSDGVMVARGDLGAETSSQEVPILQKMIIKKCNQTGKPVITATQMMESMIHKPRPTRAEAADVANAIFDGTDAVMLSGETAVGEYPVKAVKVMADIAERTEKEIGKGDSSVARYYSHNEKGDIADAVSYSAYSITDPLRPRYIVGFTLSGKTASLLSKYRPSVPVIAMSPDVGVLRRLSLYRGVHGVFIDRIKTMEELIGRAERILLDKKLCKVGDIVVIVGGVPVTSSVGTNMIKVHRIELGDMNI